jgi:signal peptidase I
LIEAPAVPPAVADSGEVRRFSAFREIPLLIIVAIVVAILVKNFVAQAFFIPSGSMEPQLQVNDRVVVSKLAYDFHSPHRGDIVVFLAPPSQQPFQPPDHSPAVVRWIRDIGLAIGVVTPSTEDYIKRVIGLPGDVVEARGGHVYVNDRLLAEPYLPRGDLTADFGPVVVPPHRLWVMGDNRGNSCDSRCFPEGAIPESSLIGRAVFRVWPVDHISFL